MRRKKISIEELQKLDLSRIVDPLYVNVPYTANGKQKTYLCKLEPALTNGEVFASTEIPANGYGMELLFYDEHEPTNLGEMVETQALEKGVGVVFGKKAMRYCTRIDYCKDKVPNELTRFIKDVARLAPKIDRMILDYLHDNAA